MKQPDLAQLIDDAPLTVCLGPGGVGKTTLAAVLALRQAAAGQRALVLTIDPARRLADALGVAGLTNDPAPVTSLAKMHPDGTLSALMLDPTATFDHLIGMLVVDPERRATLLGNRFYQHLSRSLAGTLEYMAVERLHALVKGAQFDRIVLDTPPTTNALDFLETPDRVALFFSDRVVRWFMPASARGDGRWTSRLFNRAGSTALLLVGRVAGEEFAQETAAFFGAFADLLSSFRLRGVEIGKLLRDRQTVFLVVCAPDHNRLAEAMAIDQRLREAGCRAAGFIVNRVDQAFVPEPGELEHAVERATALLGGAGERARARAFVERLESVRRAHESAAAQHALVVDELRAYAKPRPVFTAPLVPAGQSARAALLALYLGLFADAADGAAPIEAIEPVPATEWFARPGRRVTDAQ
ncbi:MAG: ArsA family ATPase [Deltaproteobacteria bacterium]|nr:ArsA family ATPase [Deltaproteobacteria bacterium]